MPTPRSTKPALILALACAAQFVVILDLAIVNVALPSIQEDFGASDSALQWIVIAYGLTLGGCLLLGGRLADLYGRRNVLATGLVLFAAASLVGGLANDLGVLIAARAVQGVGGALAVPAALAIVTATFPEGAARNKALGVFGAVGGSAGSVGVIAGGVLTSGPGWEWVFLINVPVGLAFAALVIGLIPQAPRLPGSMDVAGGVTLTAGLMAIVYAINSSTDDGWTSGTVIGFLLAGLALLAVSAVVESRVASPLLPLSLFRHRTLSASVAVSVLMSGSFFAVIFQGTLYMQQALGYSAVHTGAGWLAATLSSLVVAGGVAPRVVGRVGTARTLVAGQVVMAAGLLRLVTVTTDDGYWSHLFPAYLGMGVGMGISIVAVQIAAFSGIDSAHGGVAGGVIETSREVGGAVGVAVVATLAIARADDALGTGASPTGALAEGYQRASLVTALFSIAAAVIAAVLLRRAEHHRAAPVATPLDEPAAVEAA